MKTEQEIKLLLKECEAVRDWGMSKGPCPVDEDGQRGCCAECSMPSALYWVLGEGDNPSHNSQDVLIELFKPNKEE